MTGFSKGFAEPILWGASQGYTIAEIAAGLDIDQLTVMVVIEQHSGIRFPPAATVIPAPATPKTSASEVPAWKRRAPLPPKPRHPDDAELDALAAAQRRATWKAQREGAVAALAGVR